MEPLPHPDHEANLAAALGAVEDLEARMTRIANVAGSWPDLDAFDVGGQRDEALDRLAKIERLAKGKEVD